MSSASQIRSPDQSPLVPFKIRRAGDSRVLEGVGKSRAKKAPFLPYCSRRFSPGRIGPEEQANALGM